MKRNSVAVSAISVAAVSVIAAAAPSAVIAAGKPTLPAIKASASNLVPTCVTPGRLMVFLAQRNPRLDQRYAGIATAYMRHGEQLGIRWDYAFYQMMLETGSLSYTRDGTKPGDVKPRQNNFAGLGATGKGEPGESFASIEEGVRAHLQHLQMYSGELVEAPVAERTRKVQEWGVLTSWQKGFKRPITFTDLAGKWAPGSRGYARDVELINSDFQGNHCNKPDPKPELAQEARGSSTATAKAAVQATASETSPGVELARAALERGRAEGDTGRSSLGAKAIAAKPAVSEPITPAGNATHAVTILNEPKLDEHPAPAAESAKPAATTVALLPKPPAAPPAATPPAPGPSAAKCRVYTASYGGQKSVIIQSTAEQFINFTVLDVNDGQESREIDAYISAYAKGGHKVGDFSNSNMALDKAFELCPEG